MAEETIKHSLVLGRAGFQMPGVKSRRREEKSQKALGLRRGPKEGPGSEGLQMMEVCMLGSQREKG